MKLSMKDLKSHKVPPKSLCVWWLGQASFLVKSPAGVIAAIDPYLSNSCQPLGEKIGINFDRLTEPPILPRELVGIDLYVLTHSHQDHLDPETLGPYLAAGGRGPFLAPGQTVEKLEQSGVAPSQIVMVWPNKSHTVKDLTFRATLAIPFGGDDLTHVGYLASVKDGPTFYFTGDTDYHDALAAGLGGHKVDVLLAVINGAFRNMGPAEAARLAKAIDAKIVIPYHYDLFPDNRAFPRTFRTNLFMYNMQDRYRTLEYAVPYTYPEA